MTIRYSFAEALDAIARAGDVRKAQLAEQRQLRQALGELELATSEIQVAPEPERQKGTPIPAAMPDGDQLVDWQRRMREASNGRVNPMWAWEMLATEIRALEAHDWQHLLAAKPYRYPEDLDPRLNKARWSLLGWERWLTSRAPSKPPSVEAIAGALLFLCPSSDLPNLRRLAHQAGRTPAADVDGKREFDRAVWFLTQRDRPAVTEHLVAILEFDSRGPVDNAVKRAIKVCADPAR